MCNEKVNSSKIRNVYFFDFHYQLNSKNFLKYVFRIKAITQQRYIFIFKTRMVNMLLRKIFRGNLNEAISLVDVTLKEIDLK